jgi:hypothetical protein
MSDSDQPQDLLDAARDWRGPLVSTEAPPLVPGMQRVPPERERETFPSTVPPAQECL